MPKQDPSLSSRKQVLSDHKKVGKIFVPPFLTVLGPLSEVSWLDELLPQLVWIGLIINEFGYQEGVNLSLQLSKSAKSIHKTDICEFFAWMSSFNRLTDDEWITLRDKLRELDILTKITNVLCPLFSLYPTSPLLPLALGAEVTKEDNLVKMKTVVEAMYPRREVLATRVQSTALYFAFVNDCLKIAPGISLANFPEVEKFPDTEESRAIASSVRATLNTFYGIEREHYPSDWPITFWNRGLEIEKCESLSDYIEKQHGQENG